MEARRKPTKTMNDTEHHDQAPAASSGRRGAQLRLLNGDEAAARPDQRNQRQADRDAWHLDPVTRERGLQGVRQAREILEAVEPPEDRRWPRAS